MSISRPFKNDYERCYISHVPPALWSFETIDLVEQAFDKKGYNVNYIWRNNIRGDKYPALDVNRYEIQAILEVFFRNRIDVELQVSKHDSVSILLLDAVDIDDLLVSIKYMPKNKGCGCL